MKIGIALELNVKNLNLTKKNRFDRLVFMLEFFRE